MAIADRDVPVYNLQKIKTKAESHLEKGAITDDYPLDVNQACKLLNDALATEIMCILRYRHHQIVVKGIDRIQLAAEFKEHAEQEESHMLMLAERINQLGGNPDFNPATIMNRTATEYSKSDDMVKMIEEDLVAERIAIMIYRKLITWFGDQDPTTRRMLEVILQDEEEHADDLAELLKHS